MAAAPDGASFFLLLYSSPLSDLNRSILPAERRALMAVALALGSMSGRLTFSEWTSWSHEQSHELANMTFL